MAKKLSDAQRKALEHMYSAFGTSEGIIGAIQNRQTRTALYKAGYIELTHDYNIRITGAGLAAIGRADLFTEAGGAQITPEAAAGFKVGDYVVVVPDGTEYRETLRKSLSIGRIVDVDGVLRGEFFNVRIGIEIVELADIDALPREKPEAANVPLAGDERDKLLASEDAYHRENERLRMALEEIKETAEYRLEDWIAVQVQYLPGHMVGYRLILDAALVALQGQEVAG